MRSSVTERLLEKLDGECLPAWRTQLAPDLSHAAELRSIIDGISRARLEFDSKLFFIVVFGPVKSGKSTLVNALARDYVSPTRFSRETTRRASIVIQSGSKGIDQFFSRRHKLTRTTQHDAAELRADFDHVVHYLRGLVSEAELDPQVRRVAHEFNRENINHLLSAELDEEPLITVIRSTGGNLINSDTAILDIPGLDGHYANYVDTPSSFWAVNRADFLIFTQSSFAPLNRQTCVFLKDFYVQSRRPPVWLLQNRMEARYWKPEDFRAREAEEQLAEAVSEITTLLEIEPDSLPRSSINLGKASDGIFDESPGLLAESRFEPFEEKLAARLSETRLRVVEQNCLNELGAKFTEAQEGLESLLAELRQQTDRRNARLTSARDLEKAIAGLHYDAPADVQRFKSVFEHLHLKLEAEGIRLIHEECDRTWQALVDEFPGLSDGRKHVRGGTLNRRLDDLARRIPTRIVESLFRLADTSGEMIRNRAADLAIEIERMIRDDEKPELPGWSTKEIPAIDGTPLTFPKYRERTMILWIIPWPKRYPAGAIEGQLKRDLPDLFTRELNSRLRKWQRKIEEAFATSFGETRRRSWAENVARSLKVLKSDYKSDEAQSARTVAAARRMLTDLEALNNLVSEADGAIDSPKS